MPVPPDDIVCRFINPDRKTWNPNLNQPTQRAFKQAGLSVWHQERLRWQDVALEELLIENLTGFGQAHHQVNDYLALALQVAQDEKLPCQVRAEWRPGEVTEAWWQWRYAHVQVEATEGPPDFPLEFRRLLAANARTIVPPAN